MQTKIAAAILTLSILFSSQGRPALADDVAAKGREIFKQYQHAVVTVQEVLKMSAAGGRANETKQDLTGTVVDSSGLTVLSLSACDPSEMYQRMVGNDVTRRVETEVTDLKILLEDGNEVPAEIVLRDKDLDLAFIRPKTKLTSPMVAIPLEKSSSAQLLDEVITLNRLNSAAGRAYAASVERVSAVIQKPRTFYIPDSTMTSTTLGSPAFALDGNIVGLVLMRSVSLRGGNASGYRDNIASIILPAEDVLKAAKQAPEAKGDVEKKDSAKEQTEAKPAGDSKETK